MSPGKIVVPFLEKMYLEDCNRTLVTTLFIILLLEHTKKKKKKKKKKKVSLLAQNGN